MSLPKQVLLQAQEAERLEQELQRATNPTDNTDPEDPPVDEHAEEQPVEEPQAPAEPEPQPKPEPTPSDDHTWEQRFKSLQGKFNAEVPRLQAELKDVTSKFNALAAKMEAQERAKAAEPQRLVTDSDVEAFGSDLIDVIERKAREVAGSMVGTEMAELKARNAELEQMLSGVNERQVSNDRRAFFAELERLVPDYEAMNVDPGFLDWLAEVDPLSGMARQEYLNAAYGNFDVGRTAALFSTYKQLTAPAPKQPTRKLERQVAPGTSKVSTAVTQNGSERVWSHNEVEAFYRDVQRGAYRGNEAEQARIEAEIDLAAAEGRIR